MSFVNEKLNKFNEDVKGKKIAIIGLGVSNMPLIDYFNELLLKNNLCPMCYRRFTNKNKPTLDRIDNSKPHIKSNLKWMCRYCNCYKSNNDELESKFFIQLRNYAE